VFAVKRKLAVMFTVLGVASATLPAAQAAAAPPSVKEILDDLIVCVMAPCP
jgi:hypothetical protein